MKRYLGSSIKIFYATLIIVLLSNTHSRGQQFKLNKDASFYTFLDSFYHYNKDDKAEGDLYNQVRRDAMTWGPRLAPTGKMSTATKARIEYAKRYSPQKSPVANNTKLIQATGKNSKQPLLETKQTANNAICSDHANNVYPFEPNWVELGHTRLPAFINDNRGPGVGQINRLAFHPNFYENVFNVSNDSNQIIYAGSHFGGLYRSDDAGGTWFNYHTDRGLPITSIGGVAVSVNRVFVCTGNGDYGYDTYGADASYEPLRATVSDGNPIHTHGVYYIEDGTTNWLSANGPTIMMDGTSYNDLRDVFAEGGTMRNIIVDPNNDDILFIATSHGIFKTTSKGATWEQVLIHRIGIPPAITRPDVDWKGIVFHPTNSNIVYASGRSVFMSEDGGNTWTIIGDNNQQTSPINLPQDVSMVSIARINLAVTPADTNLVYAYIIGEHNGIDGGAIMTYDRVSNQWNPPLFIDETTNSQYLYKRAWTGIAVSPTNADLIYCGMTSLKGSLQSSGWANASEYNSNGVHADIPEVKFPPHDGTVVYVGTDGGVSRKLTSNNGNGGWTWLYNGLGVATVWSFDDWEGNEDVIVTANQDVGTNFRKSRDTAWQQIMGGDGYGVQIDDHNGNLYNLSNNDENFATFDYSTDIDLNIPPNEMLPGTFPAENHPKTDSLFLGLANLYTYQEDNFVDKRSDLELHYPFPDTGSRRILDIAFSEDPLTNYTYLVTLGDNNHRRSDFYFRNDDLCLNCFTKLTDSLPIDSHSLRKDPNPITGIAVDPKNGNRIWMSFSGFSKDIKVYYSDDAGQNWENYDDANGTLACLNMPVNNIVYQKGTKDRLYIATDVGVQSGYV